MDNGQPTVDELLVRRIVALQFPQWADLPVRALEPNGWDNRTFRLGEQMTVRLPSASEYADQVDREQHWLPRLAPLLPLQIPQPLAVGRPALGYPWKWSVHRWIEGTPASTERIADQRDFASELARFLVALQRIDSANQLGLLVFGHALAGDLDENVWHRISSGARLGGCDIGNALAELFCSPKITDMHLLNRGVGWSCRHQTRERRKVVQVVST